MYYNLFLGGIAITICWVLFRQSRKNYAPKNLLRGKHELSWRVLPTILIFLTVVTVFSLFDIRRNGSSSLLGATFYTKEMISANSIFTNAVMNSPELADLIKFLSTLTVSSFVVVFFFVGAKYILKEKKPMSSAVKQGRSEVILPTNENYSETPCFYLQFSRYIS